MDPLRDAYSSRRAVLPWQGKRPLEPAQHGAVWAQLMAQIPARGKRLLYIHVPFCANHCLFCGFYRNAYVDDAGAAYSSLLLQELADESGAPAVAGHPVHAVYLGGGTPSALSATQLAAILSQVRNRFPLAPDCEITVEGRIIHFDPDKIDACFEAGANRISIGVQSFDSEVRRAQGRRAGRAEILRFVEGLLGRDRGAIVLDLIYGLPGQTDAIWRRDVETARDLRPDGVDIYGLNVIPGTPLHQAYGRGKFSGAPGLADLGAMYRAGVEILLAGGWQQVSNNHFARTTRERNLYNLLIKEGADCLAYGSGAGGVIGRHSYSVSGDLATYRAGREEGRKPLGGILLADELQPLRTAITAGLEVGRLDLARLAPGPIADPAPLLAPLFAQWSEAGLVRMEGTVVHLSLAGRFWYGNLISSLHALLAPSAPPMRQSA